MFYHIARFHKGRSKGEGCFIFTFTSSLPEDVLYLKWDGGVDGAFQVEKLTEAEFESYKEMKVHPVYRVTEVESKKQRAERKDNERRRRRSSNSAFGFGAGFGRWW